MSPAWLLTPVVACLLVIPASAQAQRAHRPWHPDIGAARRYAQRRAGSVAFAVDERGKLRGMGMRGTAPAASVLKVMLLVSYLRMRHDRPLSKGDRTLLGPMIRRFHSQRWGVGRVPTDGWRLYFKGGWGSGSGRVDHQVALLRRGHRKLAIAVFTQFDPDHAYGKRTLRGVFARLLRGLPTRSARRRGRASDIDPAPGG